MAKIYIDWNTQSQKSGVGGGVEIIINNIHFQSMGFKLKN